MTFWDWAVEAYARPGVEAACLGLQDAQGQSVPYLLWAAWLACEGREASWAAGAALARDWEDQVVGPLRGVRRRTKALAEPALHERLKAVELDAERALMRRLEALAGPAGAPFDLAGALRQASAAWSPAATDEALAGLAAALN